MRRVWRQLRRDVLLIIAISAPMIAAIAVTLRQLKL